MKLHRLILKENFNTNQVFLHGGPAKLEGDAFKRGGRRGHDMGALFFVPESEDGYKYAIGYAISRSPNDWAVYRVKLLANDNEIFDFTNPQHRKLAHEKLSSSEFESWERSKGTSGHLDWTQVDDELLEEWGFKGAVFHERGKSVMGTSNDIVSVGIFNPKDIQIVDKMKRPEIVSKFPQLFK